ncbi:MAG: dimethylsulfoniopropionate demethylase [Pseudomonadota bacterium]
MSSAPSQRPFLSSPGRVRKTPYTRRVEQAGVKAYTVYNHTQMPTLFDTAESDYRHLKAHVQVWDVSVERQVQITGRDATTLMNMLTPRDLSTLKPGKCMYVPIVDQDGCMLNDPVAQMPEDGCYWISIADSDLLLWAKGLAVGFGLEVEVVEPDVNPLAVQGPKADDLMARVFGDAVRDIRFFNAARIPIFGEPTIVARSGFSKQGGFEIYLANRSLAEPLWDALFQAGADLNVRPGCPNYIERIEAGLLSYGNDITSDYNPYECGMGKFCQLDKAADFIGRDALRAISKTGPRRQIRSLSIEGGILSRAGERWVVSYGGRAVGHISSAAWSPDYQTNVAIGTIDEDYWDADTVLEVHTPEGDRRATVRARSFH